MKKKTCSKCKQEKDRSEFHKNSKKLDGLQVWCKSCAIAARTDYYKRHSKKEAEYDKQRKQENAERVQEYLSAHPCVDCGEADLIVLDFDHVRGEKEAAISNAVWNLGWGWKRIASEIQKCEVRCANCHRRKTHTRRNGSIGRTTVL